MRGFWRRACERLKQHSWLRTARAAGVIGSKAVVAPADGTTLLYPIEPVAVVVVNKTPPYDLAKDFTRSSTSPSAPMAGGEPSVPATTLRN